MAKLDLLDLTRATFRLGALALAFTACTIGNGIADFGNDITSQHPITFGAPQRVVAGTYSSPIVDPWDDRGAIIIAFEYDAEGAPHLAMRPVDRSEGCNTGIAYSSVVRDKLPNRAQLVAYRGTGKTDDEVPLHFIDHNCNEYGQPIVGGSLPELLYQDPPGYLVKVGLVQNGTRVTQYWAVDPWNSTSKVLASNATWYGLLSKDEQTIGVVDDGHFKMFDRHQVQLSDVGSAVTELLLLSGPSGPFLMVDGGVLFRYQSASDTSPIELARDVCQVTQDGSDALFFLSPCAERKLQRFRLDTGQATTIDTGVSSLTSSRPKPGTTDSYVLYTKPNSQSGQDLWLYSPGQTTEPVLTKFSRLYDWAPPPEIEILAMVNSDGTAAQVVRHKTSGDTVLFENACAGFSQGILGNFDSKGSFGDLYYPLQLGGTPQLAAKGVPFDPNVSPVVTSSIAETFKYGAAVITNATVQAGDSNPKAVSGDLQLMRFPNPNSPGPASPTTLASNVPLGKVQFFEEMFVIAYLENWDRNLRQGRLVSRELTLDALTNISDEVAEFQEVKWPAEGIMFVVQQGDRAGIWVAKAQ